MLAFRLWAPSSGMPLATQPHRRAQAVERSEHVVDGAHHEAAQTWRGLVRADDVEPEHVTVDLTLLPEAFRLIVLREAAARLDSAYAPDLTDLLLGVGVAWLRSTPAERMSAAPGVVATLKPAFDAGTLGDWHRGFLAAQCPDMAQRELAYTMEDDGSHVPRLIDVDAFVRGAYTAGGIRVNEAYTEALDALLAR